VSRFSTFAVAAVLGGAGLLQTPAPAAAPFYGGVGRSYMGGPGYGYGYGFGGGGIGGMGYGVGGMGYGLGGVGIGGFGLQPLPGLPSLTPLSSFPLGGSGYNYITAPLMGGYGGGLGAGPWTGYVGGYAIAQYGQQLYGGYGLSPNASYGSGGSSYNSYTALDPYQQNYYRAQKAAGAYSSDGAKYQITNQAEYEKPPTGRTLVKVAGPDLEVLNKALSASTEGEVASGEAINHILAAIQAREAKGAKPVPSAYLAPNLMAEVRFGGTPAGDTLNLLRSAGQLRFPAAFDADAMKATKEALQRDFAAVATPLLAGKPVDQAKVTKLSQTVKDAHQKLPAVTRELPHPEGADARRFVAQMESAVKVLKEAGSAALVNPKWTTEGTNVADLVKHVTKNKLQFGRADKGTEEVYLTLHRALASYLFALDKAQAAKK
jgi:hypothetical protein